ncbi:MAG: 23S rRNA (pseudouridine(1915)-N(3))-methyltransferase RlmH [Henriciella sp.]
MHITILSVGALNKKSPEYEMVDLYVDRFQKTGRHIGLRSLSLMSVDSGPDKDSEATRLLAKIPANTSVIRLDEHGKSFSSVAFATKIESLKDRGTDRLWFLIGGAAGYGEAVRTAIPETMAFGPQTWPHRLVKVMLAEQLYRAASLLSGGPYHKA